MLLGDRIKQLRKERKLTQKALAEKSNISRTYLADVEGNRYNPSLDTMKAISNALEVDINYFLTDNKLKMHSLTLKDEKDIARDLDNMMRKLDNCEDGPAFYNGDELDENDKELFKDALHLALRQIKARNKEKYNPNKNKK